MTKRDIEYFGKLGYSIEHEFLKDEKVGNYAFVKAISKKKEELESFIILIFEDIFTEKNNIDDVLDYSKIETGIQTGFSLVVGENHKSTFTDYFTKSIVFIDKLINLFLDETEIQVFSELSLKALFLNKYYLPKSLLEEEKISEELLEKNVFITKNFITQNYKFTSKATFYAFVRYEILNFENTKIGNSLIELENKEVLSFINYKEVCELTDSSENILLKIEALKTYYRTKQHYENAAFYHHLIKNELKKYFIENWPHIEPVDLSYLEDKLEQI